jgi:anti-anti-sigma factor
MRVSRHGLTVAVIERGDLITLFLEGELDHRATPLLKEVLAGLHERAAERVWVNVAGLSRIDEAGIDALLEARRRRSHRFLVRSPSSEVTSAFEARPECAELL